MKMIKKLIVFLPLVISLFIVPVKAKESSLTIHYSYDYNNIVGIDVDTYFIAYYDQGTYRISDKFNNYAIDLSHISSQNEWREIATTLSSYIIADNIQSDYHALTNDEGKVIYQNVEPGLYLTLSDEIQLDNKVIAFETFLTVVAKDDESYIVKPKYESHEIETHDKTYKVIKQWKDKNNIDERVKNVEIDIYKDKQLYESIELSAENNWSYEWVYEDDGSVFHVVERNVDEDYKVSIYNDKEVFIITNTYIGDDHQIPSTGDSSNIVFYITVMSISGLLFILLAILLRKKDHD